ncbi:acyltransferase family protein [Kineothrix sedimenti]|uniref:Acyltransferase family protein n=1 Tax=Kineothrix sedimenti TaxID=3123317 RepID=A0ABZ3EVB3_9FIRM
MDTHEKSSGSIDWIDIFKAICIILMVMGHSNSPFTIYIYMFHMTAFILISGYTYSGDKYSAMKYLKRKVVSLLLPMISINIVYILFYTLLERINLYSFFQDGEALGLISRLEVFVKYLGTPDLGGTTWFLFVLFSIEVLFKLISSFSNKFKFKNLDIIISLMLAIWGWCIIKSNIILPYLFDLSLFGIGYFSIGVLLRRYVNIKYYIDKKLMIIVSLITILFFGSFYFANQLPMNWPTRQFDASLLIQMISSLCPIYICYILSKILENTYIIKKLLIFIGKRTYIILIFHFAAFKMIFGLLIAMNLYPLDYLKKLVPDYSVTLQWLFITIVSILICLLISCISERNMILNFVFNAKIQNNIKRGNPNAE